MKIPSSLKATCAVTLSILLSNIPNTVFAESVMNSTSPMIPSTVVVAELTRAQALANVQEFLNKPEVRERLAKSGLSEKEAELRVASLSEAELKQLSTQMDQARAGGDILVAILLVVLIIFLIKRI